MKQATVILLTFFLAFSVCREAFAQSMYKSCIEAGISRYNSGKYDDAIKLFKAAAADVKVTSEEKAKANQWIEKSFVAKEKALEERKKNQTAKLEKFVISPDSLVLAYESIDTVMSVDAGSPWEVVAYPDDWCEAQEEKHKLWISVSKNNTTRQRRGEITIQSFITDQGKNYSISHTIPLIQRGREEGSAIVSFEVSPENSKITVEGENREYKSGEFINLKEGDTHISIKKPDFSPYDTVITVYPYEKGQKGEIEVSLKPDFSMIQLAIIPELGTTLSSNNNPSLKIDGHMIDMEELMSDASTRSFNTDNPVEMYKLYEGNLMPVPGDTEHFVSMTADDFEPYDNQIVIKKGETQRTIINLTAKSGTLTVNAEDLFAEGTAIILDDRIIGEVPGSFRVTKGPHAVVFRKTGFMSPEPVYGFNVEEGENIQMDLQMLPCAIFAICSNPDSAIVYIDGEESGYTPINKQISSGHHILKVAKKGYATYNEKVYFSPDGDSLNICLQKAYPLEVKSDKEGLHILFIDRKTKQVLQTDSLTNSTVYIPYGKYKMELRRYNKYKIGDVATKTLEKSFNKKDLAYRGKLNFTEDKKSIYRLTFRDKFSFIKGSYYVGGVSVCAKEMPSHSNTSYKYLADVGLLNFALIPGYTTSLARVSLFQLDKSSPWPWYPQQNGPPLSSPTVCLSASVIFLNGEFRLGGAICDAVDINANLSYSWMPNMNTVLSREKWTIPYVSGTDMFIGAEISSRIKAFNINVRIGEQLFIDGAVNIPQNYFGSGKTDYMPYGFGGTQSAFVIAFGFTLGTTRGNRMIRVF